MAAGGQVHRSDRRSRSIAKDALSVFRNEQSSRVSVKDQEKILSYLFDHGEYESAALIGMRLKHSTFFSKMSSDRFKFLMSKKNEDEIRTMLSFDEILGAMDHSRTNVVIKKYIEDNMGSLDIFAYRVSVIERFVDGKTSSEADIWRRNLEAVSEKPFVSVATEAMSGALDSADVKCLLDWIDNECASSTLMTYSMKKKFHEIAWNRAKKLMRTEAESDSGRTVDEILSDYLFVKPIAPADEYEALTWAMSDTIERKKTAS